MIPTNSQVPVILGSRSPQRRALLEQLLPSPRLILCPPECPDEATFDGFHRWDDISQRLREIVRRKAADVQRQLARRGGQPQPGWILTADTAIIVCPSPPKDSDELPANRDKPPRWPWNCLEGLLVLGQPPETTNWRRVVREWFLRYYAGRPHVVATCVRWEAWNLSTAPSPQEEILTTVVWMRSDVEIWLDTYLQTQEPIGKAGGYALQGLASVFVEKVEGSLTNVIGLPVEWVWQQLIRSGVLS
ncbi:MAG: hypothetical protein KatS3mg113_0645 [Planctomycetaceae bacterium]|nr:MAG: hypothetical protein KatS3mg113_0645 [Planctomycetaceae bacterium]